MGLIQTSEVLEDFGSLVLLPAPQPHNEILVESRCAEFVKSLQDGGAMVRAVVDDVKNNHPTRIGKVVGILVEFFGGQ